VILTYIHPKLDKIQPLIKVGTLVF